MTRCRVGDLAVIIKSVSGNEGKIVRCVKLHNSKTHDVDGLRVDPRNGVRWVIETPLIGRDMLTWREVPLYTVPDASLRPLRDPGDDAQDEMIQLLGKPESIPA